MLTKTLVEAAEDNDIATATELLGASSKKYASPQTVDSRGGVYGWTPLSVAVHKNHTDIIMMLLAAGANPNQQARSVNFYVHSTLWPWLPDDLLTMHMYSCAGRGR